MALSHDGETHLLGIFLALIMGGDPLPHVKRMSGEDCFAGHRVASETDALLRAQWKLLGSPTPPKENTAG